MVERLHPHVSKSRSIKCSNAPVWPKEASANERTDPGGSQAFTEPGTMDEQCKLHVDPLAYLPDVQPC